MENSHLPATKADLKEATELLRSELRSEFRSAFDAQGQRFDAQVQQLRSEFQHGFDDLKEAFRDGQTELLKAFYSFGTSMQQRQSWHASVRSKSAFSSWSGR